MARRETSWGVEWDPQWEFVCTGCGEVCERQGARGPAPTVCKRCQNQRYRRGGASWRTADHALAARRRRRQALRARIARGRQRLTKLRADLAQWQRDLERLDREGDPPPDPGAGSRPDRHR